MVKDNVLEQKQQVVNEVQNKFENAVAAVIVDYRGLSVSQVTDLRQQLRDAGIEIRVIKNTMLRRATENAGIEGLEDVFKGPTAVAFSNEDVVAPAKIIAEFAKEAEVLEIKGGVIKGEVTPVETLNKIATLPSREGLLSMLLSTLQAPVRNTALAFKAVAEKKEEEDAA